MADHQPRYCGLLDHSSPQPCRLLASHTFLLFSCQLPGLDDDDLSDLEDFLVFNPGEQWGWHNPGQLKGGGNTPGGQPGILYQAAAGMSDWVAWPRALVWL